jgi:hypothetical protein
MMAVRVSKDDARFGQMIKNMERVRNSMLSDRHKSIQEIQAEVGILVGNIHNLLHKDLNICQHLVHKKCKVLAKEYVAEHNVRVPYSPDVSPPEFLSPRQKVFRKVTRKSQPKR